MPVRPLFPAPGKGACAGYVLFIEILFARDLISIAGKAAVKTVFSQVCEL